MPPLASFNLPRGTDATVAGDEIIAASHRGGIIIFMEGARCGLRCPRTGRELDGFASPLAALERAHELGWKFPDETA